MANVVEILIQAKDQFSKQINNANSRIDRMNDKLKKMRGPLLAVTSATVGFGVVAVKAAMDLEESFNKATVTFGAFSRTVEDFAETSAKSFGISKQAAFEYSGTLGTILNASGLSQKATAGMSVELVKLAADIASFNNLPIDVALQKIQSGLVGSVEPLRTVGVMLSQTKMEAKALEMGLISQGEALSEAAKVQARYALIMEETIPIHGDFQNTSEGLANSMKTTGAQLSDVAATLGQALLPAAIKAVSVISDVITRFEALTPKAQNTILILAGVAGAIAAIGLAIPPVLAAMALLTGPIGIIGMAMALLVTAWAKNWGNIRGVVESAVNAVLGHFEGLVNGVIAGINFLIDKVNSLLKIAPDWLSKWLSPVDTIREVTITTNTIKKGITDMVTGVVPAIDSLTGKFNAMTGANLPMLSDIIVTVKNDWLGMSDVISEDVKPALENVGVVAEDVGQKVEAGMVKSKRAIMDLDRLLNEAFQRRVELDAQAAPGGRGSGMTALQSWAQAQREEVARLQEANLPVGSMAGDPVLAALAAGARKREAAALATFHNYMVAGGSAGETGAEYASRQLHSQVINLKVDIDGEEVAAVVSKSIGNGSEDEGQVPTS